jgi:hypothetical protein
MEIIMEDTKKYGRTDIDAERNGFEKQAREEETGDFSEGQSSQKRASRSDDQSRNGQKGRTAAGSEEETEVGRRSSTGRSGYQS